MEFRGDPFPWRLSGAADYPVLLINDEIRTLVGRLTRQKTWRGLALRPREVTRTIALLRLSAKGRTVVELFTEGLNRSTGLALVQDGPDRSYRNMIARHECFHLFQYRNRLDKRSPAKLIKHPATSTAIRCLRKHGGYDVGNAALIVSEMAAYIFSGDHSFIGLRRREAADWLSAYFRQFAFSCITRSR